ncbi:hypothetical protein KM043_011604 [Ampulex compressa]|nr:hypothetical protein KM043_011604 [Ampulex compressa]
MDTSRDDMTIWFSEISIWHERCVSFVVSFERRSPSSDNEHSAVYSEAHSASTLLYNKLLQISLFILAIKRECATHRRACKCEIPSVSATRTTQAEIHRSPSTNSTI